MEYPHTLNIQEKEEENKIQRRVVSKDGEQ